MNLLAGAATLVLWESGRFDTADIASALHVSEADVCRVLAAAKERRRGPQFIVIEGTLA
jgi:DNA-binding transcriptional regulator LsrR (DeoR family)